MIGPALFNPHTGKPRHPSDIQSDPGGTLIWDGETPLKSAPMALSNKEKQEAYRARRAMLGMTEVRGVYLPPELHAELKKAASALLKRAKPEEPKK